jgi:hypothetical protein
MFSFFYVGDFVHLRAVGNETVCLESRINLARQPINAIGEP